MNDFVKSPHALTREGTIRFMRKTTQAASPARPALASLLSIVANLEGLDLDGLRRQWRAHLGTERC